MNPIIEIKEKNGKDVFIENIVKYAENPTEKSINDISDSNPYKKHCYLPVNPSKKELAVFFEKINLIQQYNIICLENNIEIVEDYVFIEALGRVYMKSNIPLILWFSVWASGFDSSKMYLRIDDEYYFTLDMIKALFDEGIKSITNASKKNPTYKTYIMTDDSGLYKIGRSINPETRLITLRTGNQNIKLIAVCEEDLESLLHKEYCLFRKKGEWFELSDKEVSSIINRYKFKTA